MNVKILKSFTSAIGSFDEGDVQEIELDNYTFKNWVESGLIEEAKKPNKKTVKSNES
jgi:hypothetical protein